LISSVSSGGGGAARFAQLLSVSSSRSFATSSKPNQSSPGLPAVLTMYTRPGCTLCEDAVEEVQHLIDAGRIVLRRVDIDLPENERYQAATARLNGADLNKIFRCALNGSRRYLRYRRDLSRRGGANAYRVYQFVANDANKEVAVLSTPATSVASTPTDASFDIAANENYDQFDCKPVAKHTVDIDNEIIIDWLIDKSPLVSSIDPCMHSSGSALAGLLQS
uniref:Glutaredoxin-like protein n=1 Tax=Macrostomum lignano TaxID=282301 RepID=A0A1I8IG53_9PLAT